MDYTLEKLVEKMKDSSKHDFLKSEIETIYKEKSEIEKEKFSQLLAAAIRIVPFEQSLELIREVVQDNDINDELNKSKEIFDAINAMAEK